MSKIDKCKAYQAMVYFLTEQYNTTKSGDLGSLLGSMSLLTDGNTADPSIWKEWETAIEKAEGNEISDINLKFIK